MKSVLMLAMFAIVLSGCAQRSVLTDYDPNYDFSGIDAVHVVSKDVAEPSPSARHIQTLVEQQLINANIRLDTDTGILLRISASVEERPNEKSVSIGLGSGSRSANSSIGIGTSVNIPIGSDTLDYQVIQLDLIDSEQIIWTASDSAEIKVRDGKGLHQVQQRLVERLLKNFPLLETN